MWALRFVDPRIKEAEESKRGLKSDGMKERHTYLQRRSTETCNEFPRGEGLQNVGLPTLESKLWVVLSIFGRRMLKSRDPHFSC
jgi:hypothetical protein